MGPRHFSRGSGRIYRKTSSAKLKCFNGATAFQPWKLIVTEGLATWPPQLQWGHGISAVEVIGKAVVEEAIKPWLQWGHGISAVEVIIDTRRTCAD